VVVISHDRWFLDRVATHILAFEGESKVTFFDGNFSEYEARRKHTLGDAATRPHRITYRLKRELMALTEQPIESCLKNGTVVLSHA
jgi:ATPase subunit of ABC transporter with duplicated ATPase domains